MHWHIEMFGGLRAFRGVQEVDGFQTRKTAALFAYLAFYSHKSHLREELTDLLWPEAEPEAGRHRLAQALFAIRRQFEKTGAEPIPILAADRNRLRIIPTAITIDALQFDRAIADSSTVSDDRTKIEMLVSALSLYKGDFLPGFYDDWVLSERQRLIDRFVDATRSVVKHFEDAGLYDQAIQYCRSGLAISPLAEDMSEDLMRLLVACGQPGTALSYFREFERIMLKELGEPPSGSVRSLMEKIKSSATSTTFQNPQPEAVKPNLPVVMTRFFGRQTEIEYISGILQTGESRLITITGIGGSGKTRLAIEAAARSTGLFNDSVYFVSLASLVSADQAPSEIISALRMSRSAANPINQIVDFLNRRRTLLIFDNLEHIQSEMVKLMQDLLLRCKSVSIIATSTFRVGLAGEREIPLPPLQTPSALTPFSQTIDTALLETIDTVSLFVDRARAARPGFAITAANALAVSRVCEKLEGIPLAIELCAAWAQILTPEQILAKLDSRFDLLESRSVDTPGRHRSLRAAMEYSYALLPEQAQRLFASLSVFRSGWTLAATTAVADVVGEKAAINSVIALSELHSRSLILSHESRAGDEMRYRMLETVREFAAELLSSDQLSSLRERHARFFVDLVEQADDYVKQGTQIAWVQRLDDDLDNIRAAWSWTSAFGTAEMKLRFASAMTSYWDFRGYVSEGRSWLEQALESQSGDNSETDMRPYLAKALASYAHLLRVQGNSEKVSGSAREALRLYRELDDKHGIAFTLQVLSVITYTGEDCDEARVYLEEGLELARQLKDRSLLALSLANLGNIALEQSNLDEAEALYSESVKLYDEDVNRHQTSRIFNNLGLVAIFRSDYSKAKEYLQESLKISRELSNFGGISVALHNLGDIERHLGNFDEDIRYQLEASKVAYEIGESRMLAFATRELGHVYIRTGRYEQGIRLMGAAEVLRRNYRISFKPADPAEQNAALDSARTALGEEADNIWQTALNLTITDANNEVLNALMLPVPDLMK